MNGVAHVSEMTSLALHGMALIAAHKDELLNVKSIANRIGASENHLSKVLQRLVKAGFLRSVRGPGGGFELARPAGEITLLDLFLLMEGKNIAGGCPTRRAVCPFKRCLFGGVLEKLNDEFAAYLAGHTLADFTKDLKDVK